MAHLSGQSPGTVETDGTPTTSPSGTGWRNPHVRYSLLRCTVVDKTTSPTILEAALVTKRACWRRVPSGHRFPGQIISVTSYSLSSQISEKLSWEVKCSSQGVARLSRSFWIRNASFNA
ncbi:hypothetical protein EWB00_001833 [Schistosoma japonicum]|uniref:Uncharacterized protein n=1 Tax=Schistosoma japonicum TaxID=6182 RepID=A0A4Z2CK21_SCHJA|nr:hypothetical protein EWB00_001833 [Schistosoma japonicum]